MTQYLITGGSGYVAKALSERLLDAGADVRLATRQKRSDLPAPSVQIGEVSGETDWSEALKGIDIVIHLAAQVNEIGRTRELARDLFMQVNRDGTAALARAAVEAGVKRLVFLSSILACGSFSRGNAYYSDADRPSSDDAYGVSKREAEEVLKDVAHGSSLEIVMLRSPPIYGPDLTNNIRTLFKAVDRGWVLPVRSIENHLCFIYTGNLVSAICTAADHPAAAGKTYFVCDGEETSTPRFLAQIGNAMDRKARMLPCPVSVLRFLGMVSGKKFAVERLVNSLRVDGSRFRDELQWAPSVSMTDALKLTADWYVKTMGR